MLLYLVEEKNVEYMSSTLFLLGSVQGSQLYAGIEDAGIVRFEINTAARRMSACGEYM